MYFLLHFYLFTYDCFVGHMGRIQGLLLADLEVYGILGIKLGLQARAQPIVLSL